MKIKEVEFSNHDILGNLYLNFSKFEESSPEDISNIIILAGINGTGKTTIFNEIYDLFIRNFFKTGVRRVNAKLNSKQLETLNRKNIRENENFIPLFANNLSMILDFSLENQKMNSILPYEERLKLFEDGSKLIFVTADTNFSHIVSLKNKRIESNFDTESFCKTNSKIIQNLPFYISGLIMSAAFKEDNVSLKEIRAKVFKEINDTFDTLNLDIKMVSISDSSNLPIFEKNGITFDINKLSSGEKQLFLKVLFIKMLNVNDSIILVDEPEISLHPIWQQKILKVYEKIGKNNQIIMATHSPFILGSTKSENIRLLYRENGEIKVKNGNEMEEIYGKPVQRVLEDLMGLKSVRDPEVENLLQILRNLVKENKFNTLEFKNLRKEMGEILGFDSDLMLIDMEVKKRKNLKGKNL